MKWLPEYSVGIAEIDDQHQELLSLFNRVTATILEAENWSDVHYRLMELRRFSEFHFEFEEALMRMFAFPELESHAAEHSAFFQRIDRIERSAVTDKVKAEVVKFLFNWLTRHILGSDAAYARHILNGAAVVR